MLCTATELTVVQLGLQKKRQFSRDPAGFERVGPALLPLLPNMSSWGQQNEPTKKGGTAAPASGASTACGNSSGGASNPAAQMKSSVFHADPGAGDPFAHKRANFLNPPPPEPPRGMFPAAPPAAPPHPMLGDTGRGASNAGGPPSPPKMADDGDVQELLESLRAALRSRSGSGGIKAVAKNFKICDRNGSGSLDHDEVKKCLKMCKLELEPAHFDALINYVDSSGDGQVDYDEFLKAIRGRMPTNRKKLVTQVTPPLTLAPTRTTPKP